MSNTSTEHEDVASIIKEMLSDRDLTQTSSVYVMYSSTSDDTSDRSSVSSLSLNSSFNKKSWSSHSRLIKLKPSRRSNPSKASLAAVVAKDKETNYDIRVTDNKVAQVAINNEMIKPKHSIVRETSEERPCCCNSKHIIRTQSCELLPRFLLKPILAETVNDDGERYFIGFKPSFKIGPEAASCRCRYIEMPVEQPGCRKNILKAASFCSPEMGCQTLIEPKKTFVTVGTQDEQCFSAINTNTGNTLGTPNTRKLSFRTRTNTDDKSIVEVLDTEPNRDKDNGDVENSDMFVYIKEIWRKWKGKGMEKKNRKDKRFKKDKRKDKKRGKVRSNEGLRGSYIFDCVQQTVIKNISDCGLNDCRCRHPPKETMSVKECGFQIETEPMPPSFNLFLHVPNKEYCNKYYGCTPDFDSGHVPLFNINSKVDHSLFIPLSMINSRTGSYITQTYPRATSSVDTRSDFIPPHVSYAPFSSLDSRFGNCNPQSNTVPLSIISFRPDNLTTQTEHTPIPILTEISNQYESLPRVIPLPHQKISAKNSSHRKHPSIPVPILLKRPDKLEPYRNPLLRINSRPDNYYKRRLQRLPRIDSRSFQSDTQSKPPSLTKIVEKSVYKESQTKPANVKKANKNNSGTQSNPVTKMKIDKKVGKQTEHELKSTALPDGNPDKNEPTKTTVSKKHDNAESQSSPLFVSSIDIKYVNSGPAINATPVTNIENKNDTTKAETNLQPTNMDIVNSNLFRKELPLSIIYDKEDKFNSQASSLSFSSIFPETLLPEEALLAASNKNTNKNIPPSSSRSRPRLHFPKSSLFKLGNGYNRNCSPTGSISSHIEARTLKSYDSLTSNDSGYRDFDSDPKHKLADAKWPDKNVKKPPLVSITENKTVNDSKSFSSENILSKQSSYELFTPDGKTKGYNRDIIDVSDNQNTLHLTNEILQLNPENVNTKAITEEMKKVDQGDGAHVKRNGVFDIFRQEADKTEKSKKKSGSKTNIEKQEKGASKAEKKAEKEKLKLEKKKRKQELKEMQKYVKEQKKLEKKKKIPCKNCSKEVKLKHICQCFKKKEAKVTCECFQTESVLCKKCLKKPGKVTCECFKEDKGKKAKCECILLEAPSCKKCKKSKKDKNKNGKVVCECFKEVKVEVEKSVCKKCLKAKSAAVGNVGCKCSKLDDKLCDVCPPKPLLGEKETISMQFETTLCKECSRPLPVGNSPCLPLQTELCKGCLRPLPAGSMQAETISCKECSRSVSQHITKLETTPCEVCDDGKPTLCDCLKPDDKVCKTCTKPKADGKPTLCDCLKPDDKVCKTCTKPNAVGKPTLCDCFKPDDKVCKTCTKPNAVGKTTLCDCLKPDDKVCKTCTKPNADGKTRLCDCLKKPDTLFCKDCTKPGADGKPLLCDCLKPDSVFCKDCTKPGADGNLMLCDCLKPDTKVCKDCSKPVSNGKTTCVDCSKPDTSVCRDCSKPISQCKVESVSKKPETKVCKTCLKALTDDKVTCECFTADNKVSKNRSKADLEEPCKKCLDSKSAKIKCECSEQEKVKLEEPCKNCEKPSSKLEKTDCECFKKEKIKLEESCKSCQKPSSKLEKTDCECFKPEDKVCKTCLKVVLEKSCMECQKPEIPKLEKPCKKCAKLTFTLDSNAVVCECFKVETEDKNNLCKKCLKSVLKKKPVECECYRPTSGLCKKCAKQSYLDKVMDYLPEFIKDKVTPSNKLEAEPEKTSEPQLRTGPVPTSEDLLKQGSQSRRHLNSLNKTDVELKKQTEPETQRSIPGGPSVISKGPEPETQRSIPGAPSVTSKGPQPETQRSIPGAPSVTSKGPQSETQRSIPGAPSVTSKGPHPESHKSTPRAASMTSKEPHPESHRSTSRAPSVTSKVPQPETQKSIPAAPSVTSKEHPPETQGSIPRAPSVTSREPQPEPQRSIPRAPSVTSKGPHPESHRSTSRAPSVTSKVPQPETQKSIPAAPSVTSKEHPPQTQGSIPRAPSVTSREPQPEPQRSIPRAPSVTSKGPQPEREISTPKVPSETNREADPEPDISNPELPPVSISESHPEPDISTPDDTAMEPNPQISIRIVKPASDTEPVTDSQVKIPVVPPASAPIPESQPSIPKLTRSAVAASEENTTPTLSVTGTKVHFAPTISYPEDSSNMAYTVAHSAEAKSPADNDICRNCPAKQSKPSKSKHKCECCVCKRTPIEPIPETKPEPETVESKQEAKVPEVTKKEEEPKVEQKHEELTCPCKKEAESKVEQKQEDVTCPCKKEAKPAAVVLCNCSQKSPTPAKADCQCCVCQKSPLEPTNKEPDLKLEIFDAASCHCQPKPESIEKTICQCCVCKKQPEELKPEQEPTAKAQGEPETELEKTICDCSTKQEKSDKAICQCCICKKSKPDPKTEPEPELKSEPKPSKIEAEPVTQSESNKKLICECFKKNKKSSKEKSICECCVCKKPQPETKPVSATGPLSKSEGETPVISEQEVKRENVICGCFNKKKKSTKSICQCCVCKKPKSETKSADKSEAAVIPTSADKLEIAAKPVSVVIPASTAKLEGADKSKTKLNDKSSSKPKEVICECSQKDKKLSKVNCECCVCKKTPSDTKPGEPDSTKSETVGKSKSISKSESELAPENVICECSKKKRKKSSKVKCECCVCPKILEKAEEPETRKSLSKEKSSLKSKSKQRSKVELRLTTLDDESTAFTGPVEKPGQEHLPKIYIQKSVQALVQGAEEIPLKEVQKIFKAGKEHKTHKKGAKRTRSTTAGVTKSFWGQLNIASGLRRKFEDAVKNMIPIDICRCSPQFVEAAVNIDGGGFVNEADERDIDGRLDRLGDDTGKGENVINSDLDGKERHDIIHTSDHHDSAVREIDDAGRRISFDPDRPNIDEAGKRVSFSHSRQDIDETGRLISVGGDKQDIDNPSRRFSIGPGRQDIDNASRRVSVGRGMQDIDEANRRFSVGPGRQDIDETGRRVSVGPGRQDIDEAARRISIGPGRRDIDGAARRVSDGDGIRDIDAPIIRRNDDAVMRSSDASARRSIAGAGRRASAAFGRRLSSAVKRRNSEDYGECDPECKNLPRPVELPKPQLPGQPCEPSCENVMEDEKAPPPSKCDRKCKSRNLDPKGQLRRLSRGEKVDEVIGPMSDQPCPDCRKVRCNCSATNTPGQDLLGGLPLPPCAVGAFTQDPAISTECERLKTGDCGCCECQKRRQQLYPTDASQRISGFKVRKNIKPKKPAWCLEDALRYVADTNPELLSELMPMVAKDADIQPAPAAKGKKGKVKPCKGPPPKEETKVAPPPQNGLKITLLPTKEEPAPVPTKKA